MTRALAAAAILALAGSAAAQDLTIHGEWVLEGAPGTFYEKGVGKPTVVWDGGQFVMYFQTLEFDDSPPAGCPQDLGIIGRATSPDGLEWAVEKAPVLEHGRVPWAPCGVDSPAVIYNGTTWHLFFVARQGANEGSWGDRDQVGVGHATSLDGVSFQIDAQPAVLYSQWDDWSEIGHPSVVWYAATEDDHYTWSMWLGRRQGDYSDIVLATSDDRGATWDLSSSGVFGPGMATWLSEAVYNPSASCDSLAGFPYSLHFAGRSATEAAFGLATSPDGASWYVSSTPLLTWPVDGTWSGWDAVRVGEDTVVWFAQPDPGGRQRIGLAYTTEGPEWDSEATSNRICGYLPLDTSEPVDTDLPDSADTGLVGTQWLAGGCACWRDRRRPDSAWIVLLGLPLALTALRRRKRP